MKKDILVMILCGTGLVFLFRGCKMSDDAFYHGVKRKSACEASCYPRKAIYDRELDNCDCEATK